MAEEMARDGKTGLVLPADMVEKEEDTMSLEERVANLWQLFGLFVDQHNQVIMSIGAELSGINEVLNEHNKGFEALKPLMEGMVKRQGEIKRQQDRIEDRYKLLSKRLKQIAERLERYGTDARFTSELLADLDTDERD